MEPFLRFPSAVEHDPAIDACLRAQRHELRPLAEMWFARMRRCSADVRELMHDGFPTACVENVAFGYVAVFKEHVNVGFFFGSQLADPLHLLEGAGKRMRHVKLRPRRDKDVSALDDLVGAAYADVKMRNRYSR